MAGLSLRDRVTMQQPWGFISQQAGALELSPPVAQLTPLLCCVGSSTSCPHVPHPACSSLREQPCPDFYLLPSYPTSTSPVLPLKSTSRERAHHPTHTHFCSNARMHRGCTSLKHKGPVLCTALKSSKQLEKKYLCCNHLKMYQNYRAFCNSAH